MNEREQLTAISRTLQSSAASGLNASLTSDDCRLLLKVFVALNMRQTAISAGVKPPPIERIISGVADLAHNFVDDLAGEFSGPPARPARRRTKP